MCLLVWIFSLLGFSLAFPVPSTFLPSMNGTFEAVAPALTTFMSFLALTSGESTTYNQLGGACKSYTVIFARGTIEPGNVGILAGPPFFKALRGRVGAANLAVQGVGYPASVAGFNAGGDAKGSQAMAAQIQQAKAACPSTKLVASGYSQGSQVLHHAMELLDAATAAWISKIVVFGDPDNGMAFPNIAASKILTVCHPDDDICENGKQITQAHLTYGQNAAAAAAFAVS